MEKQRAIFSLARQRKGKNIERKEKENFIFARLPRRPLITWEKTNLTRKEKGNENKHFGIGRFFYAKL